ncbi:MAG TPA: CBS domain-containing protein, partial [Candidatus Limnocylindrales bacterium]|nr:CBS domain-containing protein [Candidatus Limnocylindrales bacterium]
MVRAIAAGRDPLTTQVGEVCRRILVTTSPDTGVGEAVRLMREHALRRLPVVDTGGRVTGIVSIGDIAVARDRRSALGDISA